MDDSAHGDQPEPAEPAKARQSGTSADTSLRDSVAEAIPTVAPHPPRGPSQVPPWPEDSPTLDPAGEAVAIEARAVVEPAEVAPAQPETAALAPQPADAAGDTGHPASPASEADTSEPETTAAIIADVPEPTAPTVADEGDSAPPVAPAPDETPPAIAHAASHAIVDETSLPASHVHAERDTAISPSGEPDLAAAPDPDRIIDELTVAPAPVPDETTPAIEDAASHAVVDETSAEPLPAYHVHHDLHATPDAANSPPSEPDLAAAWRSEPLAAAESLAQPEADVSPAATRDRHVATIDEHHVWSSAADVASSARLPEANQAEAPRHASLTAIDRRAEALIPAAHHAPPEAVFAAAPIALPSAPDLRSPASSWPAASPVSHGSRRTAFGRVRFAAGIAGAIALALVATVLLLVVLYRWVDPPASTLMIGQRLTGTVIEQRWVPIDRISPNLVQAVILSEDGGFCGHRGVDLSALEEAIETSRGGSTITMQVVKNLFLWPQRSYIRKALEIMLAYVVEMVWSKERILEIYLNIAEWGPGVFGAEAAARNHFSKAASRLTAQEAALLAVSLPSPIERQAGYPGWQTRRLADNLLLRMRAVRTAQRCVRVRRGGA